MSKNLEIKKGVVADIKEKFEKAQSAVLVDYRGLNVAEVTDLRNQLRSYLEESSRMKLELADVKRQLAKTQP